MPSKNCAALVTNSDNPTTAADGYREGVASTANRQNERDRLAGGNSIEVLRMDILEAGVRVSDILNYQLKTIKLKAE